MKTLLALMVMPFYVAVYDSTDHVHFAVVNPNQEGGFSAEIKGETVNGYIAEETGTVTVHRPDNSLAIGTMTDNTITMHNSLNKGGDFDYDY